MKISPRHTVISLDVGFRNTGVVIWCCRLKSFIYSEVIKTQKIKGGRASLDSIRRCQFIFRRLLKLIRVFRPKMIVGEVPHGGAQSFDAIVGMCMSTAVIATVVESSGLPFFPVTPNEVKRIVDPRAKKKVPKEAVQKFAEVRFGKSALPKLKGEREHVADAMIAFAVYKEKSHARL
jgi:Holliday junction resolvasome RuvABC endonuclease subunit